MTDLSGHPDDLTPPPAPTELQQLEAALKAKVISPELFATLAAQLRPTAAPAVSTAAPAPSATERPVSPAPASEASAEPTELPSLLSLFDGPAAPPAPVAAPPAWQAPVPVAAPVIAAVPLPPPPPAPPVARPVPPPMPPVPAPPTARPLPPPPAPPAARPVPPLAPAAPRVVAPSPAVRPTAAPPVTPPPVYDPAPELAPEAEAPAQRNTLTTMLTVLGGVGLLGVGLYLYVDQQHPSETLSGPQPDPIEEVTPAARPAAPVEAAPEIIRAPARPVPATDSSTLAIDPAETMAAEGPSATPEELTAAPAAESSPSAATNSAASPGPVPAAPEAGEDNETQKIRTVLADYYADLFAPPLNAENYFAPQVERLYIQKDLTPAQINTSITQTFFPDNKRAVYQVEPGTLRVSAPAQDGSRTVTYSEACRLFRVSKGRYQRLRTQVRAKFDADYRITFLRQERMLENVFE